MNKSAEWDEIVGQLRGRRLAVYDDLMNGTAVAEADLKVQEVLGWLVYHRFAWHDGHRYVTREIRAARELWAKDGPAGKEAADVARHQPAPLPVEAGEPAAAPARPRVHDHQPELFA